ncbi:MAG: DegV family protein [Acidimicrobiales bacterium]
MSITVVTDSASDLPAELASELGILVVPLTIRFGDEELVDGVDLSPTEFWARCGKSPKLPETAAPSSGAFREAFEKAAAGGAEGVVCINLSGALSATIEAARAAADAVSDDIAVRVVDSRSITLGEGLMAVAGANLARMGKGLDDVAAQVSEMAGRTKFYGAMSTLENLRKGGRIGAAAAAFGSLLSFKPVVTIVDGAVEADSRQRTRARSLRYLVDKMKAHAPLDQVGIVHGDAPDLEEFLGMVDEVVPRDAVVLGNLGPVVGTHSGPGSIGITFQLPPPASA